MVTGQPFDPLGFERLIARLMLIGARISEVCLVAGLLLWLVDGDSQFDERMLRAGLLALMALPVLRIALTLVEAIRLKDRLFVRSTLAVAIVLAVTIAFALSIRH